MRRRAITLDSGRRSIDLPVDGAGHIRRLASLDQRAVTRAEGDDGAIGFTGHAAVFGKRTWIGSKRWGFWEEIAEGAFAKTIREADVRFLHNHDPNLVLARSKAGEGTLRLSEDSIGLAVDADMAPTTYAQDLALLLERGDVTQMSFAFDMITYEWTTLDDGSELLRHLECGLWDVSTVTYPAYTETDAALRGDLLAVARAQGFDAVDLDRLARRLADPDPDLVASLRQLARDGIETDAGDSHVETSPPAETTGTQTTERDSLATKTLAIRTALLQETI